MKTYPHKSIVEVAQSRGSAAKTKSGAWKFLLAHSPRPIVGKLINPRYGANAPHEVMRYCRPGNGFGAGDPRLMSPRDAWKRYNWLVRIDRNADHILTERGYDPNDPNTPGRQRIVAARQAEWSKILDTVGMRIGDVVYRHNQDEHRSYSTYSKGWHRAHGPAVTISSRRVERLEFDASSASAYKVSRSIPVDAFRGNYMYHAIAQDLDLAKIKYPKHLRRIQLNEYVMVEPVRTIAGVEIYRRTFALQLVDYCVVAGDDTYHAATITEAIAGLRAKREAQIAHDNEALDMQFALSLGFCRTGVESFCEDYNLDCSSTYTRAEIAARIAAGNGRREKYSAELKKAGF